MVSSLVDQIITREWCNLRTRINLIGSSNLPYPKAAAISSLPFQSIPAEGWPGSRYFPGCEEVDNVEKYLQEMAKILFSLDDNYSVNFQPYSGTQANQIVYNAVLEPGDAVLAMSIKSGGHVSHSEFIRKYFRPLRYETDASGLIDYDKVSELALRHHPKLIIAGSSSFPRAIDYRRFSEIAKSVGSLFMADIAHTAGYVAAGLHPSPVGCADFITFTTFKTIRGPRGGGVIYRESYKDRILKSLFPTTQGAPIFPSMLAKAAALEQLLSSDYVSYAKRVICLARQLAEALAEVGLDIATGGTDGHLVLSTVLAPERGYEVEQRLAAQKILVNRNVLAKDPGPAHRPSGIRLGTLYITSLGYAPEVATKLFSELANIIVRRRRYLSADINAYHAEQTSKYIQEVVEARLSLGPAQGHGTKWGSK